MLADGLVPTEGQGDSVSRVTALTNRILAPVLPIIKLTY